MEENNRPDEDIQEKEVDSAQVEKDQTDAVTLEEPQTPSEEHSEPPTLHQKDEADKLLRQLQLAKQRGQSTVVQKLLEEATAIAPTYGAVHEAIGDDLVDRKQFRKAKEAYQHAHKLDPDNKQVENKFGEMVLRVDLHLDPTLMLQADAGTMASGRAAVVLNLLFPGLGHMVLERYVTGGILMAVWVICWIIALGTPGGMAGLFAALGVKASAAPLNPLVPTALVVAVFDWILSIGLASGAAKGMTPRKVDKPIPPEPLDY